MAKIKSIKQKSPKHRLTLYIVSDGECCSYTVKGETYALLGSPSVGSELDERDIATLKYEDECYRAMRKALSLLEASDKSSRLLASRLTMAGFSRDAVEDAVEECKRLGYVDDGRLLLRLVEREANGSLRGRFYIQRKLLTKSFSRAEINRAIDALTESGEVDFDANFRLLCEKRGVTDEEEMNALAYKFGYRLYH